MKYKNQLFPNVALVLTTNDLKPLWKNANNKDTFDFRFTIDDFRFKKSKIVN